MLPYDRSTLLIRLLALVALALPACVFTSCASYVNIPPDPKDTAVNAVNLPPVPLVMATALDYAIARYPVDRPAQVSLPAPASDRTFAVALSRIGGDTTSWLGRPDDSRNPYRVLSVRIRGSQATVEILLPADAPVLDGQYILETFLQGAPTGWSVISSRRFFVTDRRLREAARPMSLQHMQDADPERPAVEAQWDSSDDRISDQVNQPVLQPIRPVSTEPEPEPTDESSSVREVIDESNVETGGEDESQETPGRRPLMPLRPAQENHDGSR